MKGLPCVFFLNDSANVPIRMKKKTLKIQMDCSGPAFDNATFTLCESI